MDQKPPCDEHEKPCSACCKRARDEGYLLGLKSALAIADGEFADNPRQKIRDAIEALVIKGPV